MPILKKLVEFEWDQGNKGKNWKLHRVGDSEAEEVFFDTHKRAYPDPGHSKGEMRKIVIGQTKKQRTLFVVYTIRKKKIRVISARDINKTERSLYEKAA